MMKELFNKYRIPCGIIFLLLGIGFILSFFYLFIYDTDHVYNNDYYSVSYDGSWHIIKNVEDELKLSHGKGSLTFNIIELDDNKLYLDIDSLIYDIKYDIEKENNSYKLLSQEKTYLTKNHFLGYSYLYENNSDNVKVSIYKDGKYLVIITYEASSKYFDMLLDSANNIIYNFKLLEKKYDLLEKLEITNGLISYSESSDYSNLDDTYIEEIANNNYVVNYSIPKKYQRTYYNSLSGSYTYNKFSDYLKSSNLSVNIYNRNIYEYIKDDSRDALYQKYNSYRNNKNYKENIEKVDKKDNYIYKNSYIIPSTLGDNFCENVELIYSLDTNHILVVVFENKNASISKELVDSFTINYYKNISSYIKREEVDNHLVSHLKVKEAKTPSEINVDINLPLSYKELGHKDNVYEKRVFASNYNDNIEEYDINVEYRIYSNEKYAINDINSLINNNKSNGNYRNLTLEGNRKYNDKDFKVYNASFTSKNGLFYEKTYVSNVKLLIYKLSSDKVLCIKIRVNNVSINNDIINELTSFIIK